MRSSFNMIAVITVLLFAQQLYSQKDASWQSLFSLSISYGPQYNGFVDYGREMNVTDDGFITPVEEFGEILLLQKRAIGTIFTADFNLRLGGRNFLYFSHARSLNQGKYNGSVNLSDGTVVLIEDIQLRHRNHHFTLGYARAFLDQDKLKVGLGFSYFLMQQSEITLIPPGFIHIEERNYSNSYLEEGAIHFSVSIDLFKSGNFYVGLESETYFWTDFNEFGQLETLSLAPVLRYNF